VFRSNEPRARCIGCSKVDRQIVGKLYFIMGCTASGKGAVGRELARMIGGSIISVDSMKVYRRMDIGTAKPPAELRREIPHYCIDIVEPSESFSVARYIEYADLAIDQARSAGRIPLAVGGTSLYIKALSEGLFEGPPGGKEVRARLKARVEAEGLPALHAELSQVDPQAAGRIHPNDAKRIIRALEVYQTTGKPLTELQAQWDAGQLRYDCVFIGLRRGREDLHGRINRRVKGMIQAGLVEEVQSLLAEPAGLSDQACQAVGYAEIIEYLRGLMSLEKAVEKMKINTRRLARKQRTWHRRWPNVKWFDVTADEPAEDTARRIARQIAFQ